jgi:hypothetical protein
MLTQARRPLAERVQDIGAWYGILQGVTFAAVVSNVSYHSVYYLNNLKVWQSAILMNNTKISEVITITV